MSKATMAPTSATHPHGETSISANSASAVTPWPGRSSHLGTGGPLANLRATLPRRTRRLPGPLPPTTMSS